MKNLVNLTLALSVIGLIALGCSGDSNRNTTSSDGASKTASPNPSTEKSVEIQAKALTKEYDANEIAADEKFKGKMLAVSGKVSNIAETMGNMTVQLEGHDVVASVMCRFADAEKPSVAKLKKGQQAKLVGVGDGKTLGLYVGMKECKIQ